MRQPAEAHLFFETKDPIVSLVKNLNNKNNVCKKLFLLYKST